MNDSTAPSELGLDEGALERVAAYIQSDIDAGSHFGASILVSRGGKVGYRKQLGTVAGGRKGSVEDHYLLMSMSKAYTAMLVLQAIDHGRFGLDTRVSELVPGFEAGGKQRSTVRQLLSHTAGLPFGLVPPQVPLDRSGDLAVKASAIAGMPAVYAPGTRCIYTSGLGFDLLGQILVTTDHQKRGFAQIAREDLFEPLGMTNSSFGISTDDPRRVPVAFTDRRTGPGTPAMLHLLNTIMNHSAEFPSGNAYSTIDDVFKFTELIRGRGQANGVRFLSDALFDYARLDHTPGLTNDAFNFEVEAKGVDPLPARFTLLGGYVRGAGHGLNTAGHTASPKALTAVGGASTAWMVDPERDLTVVFLSSGFVEGLDHLTRVQRINDLALAAVTN